MILDRAALITVLNKIQGLTGRTTSIPATCNVLITYETFNVGEAKPDTQAAMIYATDLETGYRGQVPFTGRFDGEMALNAKKLLDIAKNLPCEEIEMQVTDKRWVKISAALSTGTSPIEYSIVGEDPANVPEMPLQAINGDRFFRVGSDVLAAMIRNVLCVYGENNEIRAHIAGALLEYDPETGELSFTGTDGARMVFDKRYPDRNSLHTPAGMEKLRVIVSKKGLKDLLRILPEENRQVDLTVEYNSLHCESLNESLTTRLLEGDFPDIKQLLARPCKQRVIVDRQKLQGALNRMAVLTSSGYESTLVKIEKNRITLTTTNPTIGESREEIPGDFNVDTPLEFSVNPKLLFSLLSVIDTGHVVLEFGKDCQVDPIRLVRPEQEQKEKQADELIACIMPMRV